MNLPFEIPNFLTFLPSLDTLDPSIVRAVLVIATVFLILLAMGISHRFFVHTSLNGLRGGVMIGILGVLMLEAAAFWLYKNYVIGNQGANLPQNIQVVLEDGKQSINQVLGVGTYEERPTAKDVVLEYKLLSPIDAELVQNTVCKQEQ